MSRLRSKDYLAFIRSLPCVACGNPLTEAAHVRYAEAKAGKPITGRGIKSSDCYCAPLCNRHHVEQHDAGDERAWWVLYGIDPVYIAMALYCAWVSAKDNISAYEAGLQIMQMARK